jgi:ribulose kinase
MSIPTDAEVKRLEAVYLATKEDAGCARQKSWDAWLAWSDAVNALEEQ